MTTPYYFENAAPDVQQTFQFADAFVMRPSENISKLESLLYIFPGGLPR
jgi:hypothetical protein